MAPNETSIALPTSIVSPTDIARLAREMDDLDNFFAQQEIRQGGAPTAMPRVSKLMDQLAADNQLNLLHESERGQLKGLLDSLHQSAPVLHISFSVDPPGPYVQKIVDWLRRNIHQHVLVTVGLQPNIGAGCVVRTTNKLFDFSLREFFTQKRDFFIEKLHQAITDDPTMHQPVVVASAPQQPAVQQPIAPAAPTSITAAPEVVAVNNPQSGAVVAGVQQAVVAEGAGNTVSTAANASAVPVRVEVSS